MKKNIVCILLILLVLSCNKEKESQVDVIDAIIGNIDNERTVFPDFSFIKLETNDDCLLEKITKVEMQDAIYILSSYGGNIYKFTKEGRFLWHLKQGNGPGELIFATDFHIDHDNQLLVVLDNYRVLKKYALNDGRYLGNDKLPGLAFLFLIHKDMILSFDPNLEKKSLNHVRVSKEKEILWEGMLKDKKTKNVGFMPSNVFVPSPSGQYYIQHMLSDTIYSFSFADHKLIPACYINTGGISANSKDINFKDARSFHHACKDEGWVAGLANLALLEDKFYLTMYYEDRPVYVIYDKEKKSTVLSEHLCDNLPNSVRCVGRGKNELIYSYDTSELLQFYEKKKPLKNEKVEKMMQTIKEDDNPILVFFHPEVLE